MRNPLCGNNAIWPDGHVWVSLAGRMLLRDETAMNFWNRALGMRLGLVMLAVLLAPMTVTGAIAQEDMYDEYLEIYRDDSAGDAEKFPRFLALAERGHPRSQYRVGYQYWWGFGVEESKSEARRWYIEAANNGFSTAANDLGKMYEEGDSVVKSSSEAFKWYMRAAELGHADAMSSVSGHYYRGDGVPKSMTSAAYWAKEARDAGDAVGGMMFTAIQKEFPDAVANMSRGTAYLGTPNTIAEPQAKAPQITAASEGFRAFENGNYAAARTILLPHANNGDGDAQNVLGIMYLDGLGVGANDATAASWFRKAANSGNPAGLYHLGAMIYYQRTGGGVDPYGTAKSMLERAAQQGSDPARNLLATMEEEDRLRRIRDKQEYEDSLDDIDLNRCRNPRYVKVNGQEKIFCD